MTIDRLDLSGWWDLSLDPCESASDAHFDDMISLPGTLDEQHKGKRGPVPDSTMRYSRLYSHVGRAWYRRSVTIPQEWAGRRARLFVERTKFSALWLDGRKIGAFESLIAPHRYDWTAEPGEHTLTLMVNNDTDVWGGHQVSDDTQTNWNGLLGEITLSLVPDVEITLLRLVPEKNGVKALLELTAHRSADGQLRAALGDDQATLLCPIEKGVHREALFLPASEPRESWNEFSPYIQPFIAQYVERGRIVSSLRRSAAPVDFHAEGTQFRAANKTVFLRGRHDACVFPKTGYAPMKTGDWVRVLATAQQWGLNHYRCHTWAPPEAALYAADCVGVYFQPELGGLCGEIGSEQFERSRAFLLEEGRRYIREYGWHPSFVMFSLGNEIRGRSEWTQPIIRALKDEFPYLMMAQGSNNDFGDPHYAPDDDYWTTFRTKKGGGNVRAAFSYADKPLGHVQAARPDTAHTYEDAIAPVPAPVIGHEVGQFQIYPDFDEIAKYDGVVYPRNLEIFRMRLAQSGLLGMDKAFHAASGRLAARLYREECEAALRTRGFGGFQLLDLQDFPGQGTALVGLLDAFMDEKGVISADEFRKSCDAQTLLLSFSGYVRASGETMPVRVLAVNYGAADMNDLDATVSLLRADSSVEQDVSLYGDAPQGCVTALGTAYFTLPEVNEAEALTLRVTDENGHENDYPLWVYPERAIDKTLIVSGAPTDEQLDALESGADLLILPGEGGTAIPGGFASDFWNYAMFRRVCEAKSCAPSHGLLGLCGDRAHPALRHFPCDGTSDWQWFDIAEASHPAVLDDTPALRPIVWAIDNPERNHRLGLIFEARVGQGRVLICESPLDRLAREGRIEAANLLYSLTEYMKSRDFRPETVVTKKHIRRWTGSR